MIKLKTEQRHKFGQVNHLPIIGDTQISEEGIIEVEDQETAEAIAATGCGFDLHVVVNTAPAPKPTTTTTSTTTTTTAAITPDVKPEPVEEDLKQKAEENNDLGGTDDQNDFTATTDVADGEAEKQALLAELEGQTLEQLQVLAKPFTPKRDWAKLNQPELVEFLKNKLTATA